MSNVGSVSQLLAPLKAGDRRVVERLWGRYCQVLLALAGRRLQGYPWAGIDAEDVTLSAFDSFIRAAEQDRFPQLEDRHDLWRLLATITVRKACRHLRDEARNNGFRVTGSVAQPIEDARENLVNRQASPDVAIELAEEAQRLLNCLSDSELQSIAVWKLEGYTNREIAVKMDCSPRTIERRLELIRRVWQERTPEPS